MTVKKILCTIIALTLIPLFLPVGKAYIASGRAKQDVMSYYDKYAPATTALLARYTALRTAGTLSADGVPAEGDFNLKANGQQTLTAEDIDTILASWGS